MKRFTLYVVAASLLLTGALSAQPQQRMMMQREHDGPMGRRLGEQLNLTDEQKDQIHQILLDARKKNIDTEAKQKVGQIEMSELMMADAPDQGKIDAKIKALSQLHEARMRSRIETMLAVHKLLTPEQRKKAKEMRIFDRLGHHDFGGGPGCGLGGRMGKRRMMDAPHDDDDQE